MGLIIFLLALFLGPVIYHKGKKSFNVNLQKWGFFIWVLGWGYLVLGYIEFVSTIRFLSGVK